jgi:hypothetical protein
VRFVFLSQFAAGDLIILESIQSLARKAVTLCIEGMKNPTLSNEMLRIVLDLAMVHQSVLELTFRRPAPERPNAVRCVSILVHCAPVNGATADQRTITAVD